MKAYSDPMRLFLFLALVLSSCSKKPSDPLPDQVTYIQHMVPLFQVKCQPCHNNSTPDRNWMEYNIAYNKRSLIKLRIENRTMPLGISISEQERQLIIKWVDQGAKK
jgi:hypothetical protein